MGERGRTILWIIASVLLIPTCCLSLLVAQYIEDEYYHS